MPRQAPALLLDGCAMPAIPARHRASRARKAATGKQIPTCRQKMQNRPEKPIASVLCGARCAARTGDEGATACLLSLAIGLNCLPLVSVGKHPPQPHLLSYLVDCKYGEPGRADSGKALPCRITQYLPRTRHRPMSIKANLFCFPRQLDRMGQMPRQTSLSREFFERARHAPATFRRDSQLSRRW